MDVGESNCCFFIIQLSSRQCGAFVPYASYIKYISISLLLWIRVRFAFAFANRLLWYDARFAALHIDGHIEMSTADLLAGHNSPSCVSYMRYVIKYKRNQRRINGGKNYHILSNALRCPNRSGCHYSSVRSRFEQANALISLFVFNFNARTFKYLLRSQVKYN